MSTRLNRSALCFAFFGFAGAAVAQTSSGQVPGDVPAQEQQSGQKQDVVQQKLAELQNRLQQLNLEIEQARSAATENEAVTAALLDYNEALSREMKAIDPNSADKIDKRTELFEEVSQYSSTREMTPEDLEAARELHGEFAQVREELRLTESQASQKDSVLKALEDYNTKIIGEMKNVDSDIESKLVKRQELREEFASLQSSISQ